MREQPRPVLPDSDAPKPRPRPFPSWTDQIPGRRWGSAGYTAGWVKRRFARDAVGGSCSTAATVSDKEAQRKQDFNKNL
ncbi:hypothetical protein ACQJBY_036244 [Aegilops geniculata]